MEKHEFKTFTVGELIKELEKYNKNMEVVIEHKHADEYANILSISKNKVPCSCCEDNYTYKKFITITSNWFLW